MKLTIEITDEQLERIKLALRIRSRRARDLFNGITDDSEAAEYADRILQVRRIFEFSPQAFRDIVSDELE